MSLGARGATCRCAVVLEPSSTGMSARGSSGKRGVTRAPRGSASLELCVLLQVSLPLHACMRVQAAFSIWSLRDHVFQSFCSNRRNGLLGCECKGMHCDDSTCSTHACCVAWVLRARPLLVPLVRARDLGCCMPRTRVHSTSESHMTTLTGMRDRFRVVQVPRSGGLFGLRGVTRNEQVLNPAH